MTTTPNLALTHLEAGTTSPEVVTNAIDDGLDHAMNSSVTINFSSDANLTLSTTGNVPQQWQYGTIVFTDTGPVLTTGRNVIVPTNKRIYRIKNSTAQTLTVKTSAGTGIAVTASDVKHLQCDGTNVIDISPGGGSGIANVVDDTTPQLGGDLDVNGNSIVSVSAGDIAITPDTTGSVILDGLSWPQADGTNGQVLTTNGAGALSFTTVSGGSGLPASDDTVIIQGNVDSTKQLKIEVDGLTTSTTRTWTAPDADITMAGINLAQTFSAEQTFTETKDTVYNLTGTAIDPANGGIQYKTLSANTTFTESLDSGQGVLLRIAGGATYTVTWPTMTWVGGTAPTLTADDVVVIWQEQTTVYGLYVGSVA